MVAGLGGDLGAAETYGNDAPHRVGDPGDGGVEDGFAHRLGRELAWGASGAGEPFGFLQRAPSGAKARLRIKLSHPVAMMGVVAEARSLRFAATARALGEAARARGLAAPTFRSPPRIQGSNRSIRRHASGGATVSLVLRDRPWSSVVADMIDGFAAVNPDADVAELRDVLWGVVEQIDLTDAGPASTRPAAAVRAVPTGEDIPPSLARAA